LSASRAEIARRLSDVDHAVEQLLLVRHVLVERHRHDAELLREAAHAERF
jgi:thioesterase domain-containing protein